MFATTLCCRKAPKQVAAILQSLIGWEIYCDARFSLVYQETIYETRNKKLLSYCRHAHSYV